MSEKRFTLTDWHEVKDNGKVMTVNEVVSCLNEQQATIEQLRKLNNAYAEKFAKIVNLISEDVVIDDE